MMKRILGAILTAVFLSVLCIPCAAADTARVYPGFSDVAEENTSYEAIKLCYERGLMNGTSDTAFNPQGQLNVAQLVVLAARLYDLQNGGDGTVPSELPDLSQSYLRFYDKDGSVIASYSGEETVNGYTGGINPYFCLSLEENDATLPETCRLEVGFEGYNHLRSYQGIKQSYHSEPGTMTHGYQGTGYTFQELYNENFLWYMGMDFQTLPSSAWWYPSLFYLISESRIDLFADLLAPLAGEPPLEDFDVLTHFSTDSARRDMFAWLVSAAAGELDILNETVNVPDVNPEETQNAVTILRLYQAGVLTGVDEAGNFGGERELTRAQAAIMLARVLDPTLRVKTA